MTKTRLHPEQDLQFTCVEWLTYCENQKRLLFTHVNNASPNPKEGDRLKKMGVRPGFPDLILFFPNGRVALVEMKAEGKKLDSAQDDWFMAFHNFLFPYFLCRSFKEMEEIVSKMETAKPLEWFKALQEQREIFEALK